MVAVAQAVAGKRKSTRRALQQKVKELEGKLGAAAGETRKNLRERIARLAEENKKLQDQNKELTGERDKLIKKVGELEAKIEAAEGEKNDKKQSATS